MAKDAICENAIMIYEALTRHFALSIDDLKSITKLDEDELIPALVWMLEMKEVIFIKIKNETKICLTENE